MNSIILGNGINIQFGGKENLNSAIINRALNNIKSDKHPSDVYPKEIAEALPVFCTEIKRILNSIYDDVAITSYEKQALADFKERYSLSKIYKVDEVGFEDYYFIFDLVARKNKLVNPERYHAREGLKCFFVDSIFNENKVNLIYKKFPLGLKEFFETFDTIFTTNYDENIDVFTAKEVLHLHGSFNIIAEVYNTESLRNKIPNPPMQNYKINQQYKHLYSNVLTSYSGFEKDFSMNMHGDANIAIEKFTVAYEKDEKLRADIDSWAFEENELVRNMYHAIMCKIKEPELKINDYYPIEIFKNVEDTITFIGLSPYNDTHLFKTVNSNAKLKNVVFYYYNDSEINSVKKLLPNSNIEFINVGKLWESII